MSDWIAYVGPFTFPWGQPGSRRVFGIASALAESGFRVVVGSGQWGEAGSFSVLENENIEFFNLGDSPPLAASIPQKIVQLFFLSGIKTVRWLSSMQTLPKCVVVYGAGAPFMSRVTEWCQKRGVPLVADVVEWYDGTHMSGGYFGPFHISAKLAMHYYFPRCDGVIAISELLAEHYKKQSRANVVRVPPITDVLGADISESRFNRINERIKLVYAGTPGKKDLLGTVIQGVAEVDPDGSFFQLQVMGPSEDLVRDLLGGRNIPPFVDVLGRLPQESVAQRLQEADFSVLIREPKRFANAGFSTKFVESLMNGTPVIANYTSDLQMYLRDGVEGIVCSDHSIPALANALKKIRGMSKEALTNMRYKAREQALASFDYRNYKGALSAFINGLCK